MVSSLAFFRLINDFFRHAYPILTQKQPYYVNFVYDTKKMLIGTCNNTKHAIWSRIQ